MFLSWQFKRIFTLTQKNFKLAAIMNKVSIYTVFFLYIFNIFNMNFSNSIELQPYVAYAMCNYYRFVFFINRAVTAEVEKIKRFNCILYF